MGFNWHEETEQCRYMPLLRLYDGSDNEPSAAQSYSSQICLIDLLGQTVTTFCNIKDPGVDAAL